MAKKLLPSVLAFEKKLVPSDGYFFGTCWDNRKEKKPLQLQEKSVRGTISNRLKPALQKDPAKLNQEVEKANLQRVDSCQLSIEQDTLALSFTLKVLGDLGAPSACNNSEFKQSYQQAVSAYVEEHGFRELANRYAMNVANARFLWRNRLGAEHIEVNVKQLNGDQKREWNFNARDYSVRNFNDTDEKVKSLAEQIANVLASSENFLLLEITCFAKVGEAQEVYPSEELVLDKGKGEKSKILYQSTGGQAAMHSQKLGNAIRSIDTWYPDFSDPEKSAGPIAVDPYGAVTNLGTAYRNPKDTKKDFFTLFDSWALGNPLSPEETHYVMATLVRGGVFGESDK